MSDSAPSTRNVTVIGAGIVGLSAALYLQREGRSVTLIDRGPPGEGASYGNAGVFAAGSVTPLGMPGMVWKVPGMLMDPLGPLRIRPAYLLQIMPWLVGLLRHSTPARIEAISTALATIVRPALAAYEPLFEEAGAGDLVGRNGSLFLYETEADFRHGQFAIELRRRRGIELQVLAPEEVRQMIPAIRPDIGGAVFVPGSAHCLNPLGLSQAFARHFDARGGRLLQERVDGFEIGPDGPRQVRTEAGSHEVGDVVIAAGAFSRDLARQLGSDVPLDTERGYHVMLPNPGLELRLPMLCASGGFAATPMQHGLRFAGTVEFGGLDAPPNYARADAILQRAKKLLPGLQDEGVERWMGFRPSIPDSLPVIGRSPRFQNVYLAFGHGHLGLTLGAVTGRLIADLVAGREPDVDVAPFRIDRF